MRILIIRHGEPDYSIDSLTEKGWREVNILSDRLIKERIDYFFCSPLGRAKDTAKPTLEKYGREAEILPWMAEFRGNIPETPLSKHTIPWDLHPLEWQTQPEVFEREEWVNAPIMKGGTVATIYEETKKGVDELLGRFGYIRDGEIYHSENNKDITIALFCHFALGSAVLGYLTGVSPFLLWHHYFLPTSSVTTVLSSEVKKGDIMFRCMQMGDTSHLYQAGEPLSASGLMPEVYDPTSERNIDVEGIL